MTNGSDFISSGGGGGGGGGGVHFMHFLINESQLKKSR